ncbi:hypothetical protein BH23ACT3_BH23ACT3_01220 [soil metagenome]
MKRLLMAAIGTAIGLALPVAASVEARPDRYVDIDTGLPHFRSPHAVGLDCPGTVPGALGELRHTAKPGLAEAIWHQQTGPGGESMVLGTTKVKIIDIDIRVYRLGDIVFGEPPSEVMDHIHESRPGPRNRKTVECAYYDFTPGPGDQYQFAAAFVGTVKVFVPGGFPRDVTG